MRLNNRGNIDSDLIRLFVLFVFLIIVILTSFRGVLVEKAVAIRALEKQGYNNIEITNHQYFFVGWKGCDDKDAAKFTARVTNPAGKQVEVFVCTGWLFKGATIRTD